MINKHTAFAALATIAGLAPAHADITISTAPTQNISCSGGICAATAADAVLNVNDLEGYLASGNIEVTTAGSGVDAENIDIESGLTWSNSSALSLVATEAVTVDRRVSVTGGGGLAVTTDGQNEHFSFGSSGHVTFSIVSSSLTINGASFTLLKTVKSLAKAIANNPDGYFALAKSADAEKSGTYNLPPVFSVFYGTLDGLGNAISNLTVKSVRFSGLFKIISTGAVVRNLGITNAIIILHSRSYGGAAGALAAENDGYISHCSANGNGNVSGGSVAVVGGLIGLNEGTVSDSYSTATVVAKNDSPAGGLVGWNVSNSGAAVVKDSFATGSIDAGKGSYVGGLVGENYNIITNSYSTAKMAGRKGYVGGLAGATDSTIADSYSSGSVQGYRSALGGFVGYDESSGSLSDNYWDTDTSDISNLSQGAGYPSNDPGITGLTTEQFQSGLPAGFDPSIWAEDASVNNGLPYLINNPPPK